MALGGTYLVEGAGIWVEGVTPAVEACGMWKEEEDGVGCRLPA